MRESEKRRGERRMEDTRARGKRKRKEEYPGTRV